MAPTWEPSREEPGLGQGHAAPLVPLDQGPASVSQSVAWGDATSRGSCWDQEKEGRGCKVPHPLRAVVK